MVSDKQWLLDVNIAYLKGKTKGRTEAIDEIKELAHEDITTGNMIISLADVEKLKE